MTYVFNRCPECDCDLEGIDREKHGLMHWGTPFAHLDRLANEDAKKRYRQLMEEQ